MIASYFFIKEIVYYRYWTSCLISQ